MGTSIPGMVLRDQLDSGKGCPGGVATLGWGSGGVKCRGQERGALLRAAGRRSDSAGGAWVPQGQVWLCRPHPLLRSALGTRAHSGHRRRTPRVPPPSPGGPTPVLPCRVLHRLAPAGSGSGHSGVPGGLFPGVLRHTHELCSGADHFEMCPLCLDCPFWLLSSACTLVQAGRLFDHGGTVFFSVFMALWAVLLLEYWKRQSATLAYRWGCSDYEDIEERPRPQFAASAPTTAPNPVTGEDEPYFPERSRVRRVLAGSTVVVMMVAVVVMCLVSIILYRAIMAILVSRSNNTLLAAWASRVASFTGSVVNLVFILVLSKIYVALAHILTRWEMHRTQTKFEDAFTLKVFIFQFVNFYSSPIYIAFFKGRFVGYPGNYHTLFGVRNEECAAGGCLIELAQELLVIMVGKQIINNVQEILVPKLQGWWQKFRLRSKKRKVGASEAVGQAPWEADYELLPCEGLFDEYLEMVLQFGFVAIFVAACPLAPLFALLNNWVEIRLDARKFVCEHRRPVAERAQDIGVWSHILAGIAHLAVVSNAFLLAFSSDFLPRAYYRWTRAPDLRGFVNFTLARAPPAFASAHNRTCRYQAFREDDGQYSATYWNLLAIRLAFVIVFELSSHLGSRCAPLAPLRPLQASVLPRGGRPPTARTVSCPQHVVFSIGRILDLLVPDIPESVEVKVKREYYLAKQALAENEALSGTNGAKDNYSQSSERSLGPQPTLPGGGQASRVPSL
ncbi:anoctamin-7 isoform X3 [Felis catus]|uniref:anoctamin-7 isoform X3 n=1 Tax=Felis catus TaxID=9685 RepID=UPI001D19D66C|nr:anoctamin-7 isoform X3 [Felis catus]